jgi:hypothetical protein
MRSVFSTVRPSGRGTLSQWRRLSQQPKERYSDFVYLFAFHNVSKASNLVAILNSCFPSHTLEFFNFSTFNVKINVSKDSVKYLHSESCVLLGYDAAGIGRTVRRADNLTTFMYRLS